MTRLELLRASVAELTTLMADGHRISSESLAGFAYDGVSLGLPRVVEALTWKTFQKAFVRDEARGCVRGWNVRLEQRGLDAEPTPKRKNGTPITFGHFMVRDDGPQLLLDYGVFERGPLGRLRDPLVGLGTVSGCDTILGRTMVRIGRREWPTPSFFLLLGKRALRDQVSPPGAPDERSSDD